MCMEIDKEAIVIFIIHNTMYIFSMFRHKSGIIASGITFCHVMINFSELVFISRREIVFKYHLWNGHTPIFTNMHISIKYSFVN